MTALSPDAHAAALTPYARQRVNRLIRVHRLNPAEALWLSVAAHSGVRITDELCRKIVMEREAIR